MTIDEKIKAITKDKPNSLYITFNDHWTSYEKPEEVIYGIFNFEEGDEFILENFISIEDYNKCVKENSFWHVQYYDRTPVGFVAIYASSLELALDYILQSLNN